MTVLYFYKVTFTTMIYHAELVRQRNQWSLPGGSSFVGSVLRACARDTWHIIWFVPLNPASASSWISWRISPHSAKGRDLQDSRMCCKHRQNERLISPDYLIMLSDVELGDAASKPKLLMPRSPCKQTEVWVPAGLGVTQ